MLRYLLFVYFVFGNRISSAVDCPGNQYNARQQTKTSTCLIWGNYNIKTFDDLGINFKSGCTYNAVSFQTLREDFNIAVGGKHTNCAKSHCFTFIEFLYHKVNYRLTLDDHQVPTLIADGKSHGLPIEIKDLRVHRPGTRIAVEFLDLEVVIKWDGKSLVQITIPNDKGYETIGLCGNNDKCSRNDHMLTDNTVTNNVIEFVNEYQTDKRTCHDEVNLERCKTKMKEMNAVNACHVLKDHRFKEANQLVAVEPYILACIMNQCSCTLPHLRDCLCDTFDAYAKASVSAGLKRVAWRNENNCPKRCTGSLEFYPCAPKGGALQCGTDVPKEVSTAECEEGCYCPANTYLFEGDCYVKKDCPCSFAGTKYMAGASFQQECNTCTCTNGELTCTRKTCYVQAHAFGDPHYRTWDGKTYDFMGQCAYYLVKGKDFSIAADHYVYKNGKFIKDNSSAPSYTRHIIVKMLGQVIELKPNLVVSVNQQLVKRFPQQLGPIVITKPSSSFVLVVLPNKIQVEWDGYSTVKIKLPTTMKAKVAGLFGTYTEDQSDDFTTPDGDIVNDPVTFGNSWKTEDSCPDMSKKATQHPCDAKPSARAPAERICSAIKSDIFQKCHMQNANVYYESCVYDTCFCQNEPHTCACDIMAAFADGCAEKGIVVYWRQKIPECRKPCPAGQEYQECGDPCTRSCEDLSMRPTCEPSCIEGCNCPGNTTLNEEGICIPMKQCKCRQDGLLFPPDYKLLQNKNELLTCKDARWIRSTASTDQQQIMQSMEQLNDKCDVENFSVYTPCLPSEYLTCRNMHDYQEKFVVDCREGCQCMDGLVLDGNDEICVRPEECSCYHKGRSYPEGSYTAQEECQLCTCVNKFWECKQDNCDYLCFEENEVKQVDCNNCTCLGGKWKCDAANCKETKCDKEDDIKMGESGKCICKDGTWKCIEGQCDIWGDSHVKTFDGLYYDFLGECSYILASGTMNGDEFRIHFLNERCSHTGVTCLKSFTITTRIRNIQETLMLDKNIELPQTASLKHLKLIDKILYVRIEIASLGVQIFWDKNTWIYVKVDPKWQGNVEGLCGNYNKQKEDDHQTRDNHMENKGLAFVDMWKMNARCSPAKPNTNNCDNERAKWAEQQCGALLGPDFKSCHQKVPVEDYYHACVMDSCKCDLGGDCDCLCTAIATYVQQCNNFGVSVYWRKQQFCPIQCPDNTHYEPCVSNCPAKTCESIRNNTKCEEQTCTEGCAPKSSSKGYVYTDASYNRTVTEYACSMTRCYVDGVAYYHGEITLKEPCRVCDCQNGKINCFHFPCSDNSTTDEPTKVPASTTSNGSITTASTTSHDGNPIVSTSKTTSGKGASPTTTPEDGGISTVTTSKTTSGKDSSPTTTPVEDLTLTPEPTISTTNLPTTTPKCEKVTCKKLNCPHFAPEIQVPGQCCRSCQHKDACLLWSPNGVIQRQPGYTWSEGPCTQCKCDGQELFNHCIACRQKICSKDRITSTVIDGILHDFESGACCPALKPVACVHQTKTYRVGEEWSLDHCTSLKCIYDPSNGAVRKEEIREFCNEECPLGYVYRKQLTGCCGKCVQNSCVFGNEVKRAGETWYSIDACSTYNCDDINGQYVITSRRTICPEIKKCSGEIKQGRCCNYCSTSEVFTWRTHYRDCHYETAESHEVPSE